MDKESIEVIKRAFKRYYFYKYSCNINKIEMREFGYTTFEGQMVRHLSFKNGDEVRAFLVKEVPADVYASNAYYRNPTLEMDLKDWLGADLIFDIDIKNLKLTCMKNHLVRVCSNCKIVVMDNICSVCNSTTKEVNIPCEECIATGKREVTKLLDLLNDLGCSKVSVYFSGNNGFHLHIKDEEFLTLDSEGRREISDYVCGKGIIPEVFGINIKKNDKRRIREAINIKKGWRGRILKRLSKSDDELFKSLLRKNYDKFSKELSNIVEELGSKIDPVVTIDIHRIFRLENTLSSKSGLTKIKVESLDKFDPFVDACLIDDEDVRIHVIYSPRFRLKDRYFGPYKDVEVNIPLYAATYLLCKGLAYTKLKY